MKHILDHVRPLLKNPILSIGSRNFQEEIQALWLGIKSPYTLGSKLTGPASSSSLLLTKPILPPNRPFLPQDILLMVPVTLAFPILQGLVQISTYSR